MEFNSVLIIVIIVLGIFTIKTIYNITKSIKNKDIKTKYGENGIKKGQDIIDDNVINENEVYERKGKKKTYARRRTTIEIKDEKYLQAKKYSNRIKITSAIGWIISIMILIIYYIKNNKF